jgi:transposase
MVDRSIRLTAADRAELERRIQSSVTGERERIRARALLFAAKGLSNAEVERRSGLGREQVAIWRSRFLEQGIGGLDDLPRPGRPRIFGSEVRGPLARLVASGDRTWTIRSAADAVVHQVGVSISRSQVRRILIESGHHPGRRLQSG